MFVYLIHWFISLNEKQGNTPSSPKPTQRKVLFISHLQNTDITEHPIKKGRQKKGDDEESSGVWTSIAKEKMLSALANLLELDLARLW